MRARDANAIDNGAGGPSTPAPTLRMLLPLLVVAVVLAACGSFVHHTSKSAIPAGTTSLPLGLGLLPEPSATVRGGVVRWSGAPVAAAFDTADGLLLAWPLSDNDVNTAELARVNPSTGAVEAGVVLPTVPQVVVAAGRWLWAAASGTGQYGTTAATVWQLAPGTLADVHRQVLGPRVPGIATMAVAGGWLWVAHGATLTAVSTTTGAAGRSVALAATSSAPGPVSSAVVTDPATGDLLAATVPAGGGPLVLQRRDPTTGTLLASVTEQVGGIGVRLAPPVDGRLWVTLITGMQGGVRPYDTATLQPAASDCDDGAQTAICFASNTILARAAGGSVFVTQPGGAADNQCIDPSTATTRADLPVTAEQNVLSVGPHGIVVASPGAPEVALLPMPARCVSPPPICHFGQLTLTITNAGVATGQTIMAGTFENRSSAACTLAGYPALQMLNADGRPIVTTVRRETPEALGSTSATVPQRIDLGPGQQASFTITTSDGSHLLPPLPSCSPASSLLVAPPGTTRGLQATIPAAAGLPGSAGLIAYPYAAGEPCGTVLVSALIPGSAARALCPACSPPPAGQVPARHRQRTRAHSRPAGRTHQGTGTLTSAAYRALLVSGVKTAANTTTGSRERCGIVEKVEVSSCLRYYLGVITPYTSWLVQHN